MLDWVELATLPGPGGASWAAEATAEDGARLVIETYGGRPGQKLLTLLRSSGPDAPPSWVVTCDTRPPSLLELIDATGEAAGRDSTWWALSAPWCAATDVEGVIPPCSVRGSFAGPVRVGEGVQVVLPIMGAPAPREISHA